MPTYYIHAERDEPPKAVIDAPSKRDALKIFAKVRARETGQECVMISGYRATVTDSESIVYTAWREGELEKMGWGL